MVAKPCNGIFQACHYFSINLPRLGLIAQHWASDSQSESYRYPILFSDTSGKHLSQERKPNSNFIGRLVNPGTRPCLDKLMFTSVTPIQPHECRQDDHEQPTWISHQVST